MKSHKNTQIAQQIKNQHEMEPTAAFFQARKDQRIGMLINNCQNATPCLQLCISILGVAMPNPVPALIPQSPMDKDLGGLAAVKRYEVEVIRW